MTHTLFESEKIDFMPYLRSQQFGEGTMMEGRGGDMDYENAKFFRGIRYQKGYGVKSALASVGRFLLPIAQNLATSAKSEAQDTLANIGSDLAQGRPVTETLKEQGKQALRNFGSRIQQCGKGKKSPHRKRKILKNISLAEISGEQASEPITSGPNPVSNTIRKRKRRADYLDF